MSEHFAEEVEETSDTEQVAGRKGMAGKFGAWAFIGLVAVLTVAAIGYLWSRGAKKEMAAEETHAEEKRGGEHGAEVKLSPEMLEAAKIEIEGVTSRPAVAKMFVTGTVELNPENTEMATPLVGGRVENVFFGVGDYVRKGQVLAVIASPQLAQMHGKMHEAETHLELAERNLARTQKSENRVAVLQAKARLDEAEANLKRAKKLIELGAGAGKDLVSAEANYKTAQAEYEFQSNITLNKEIQEAKAEVETSRVDLRHIIDEMRSLGVDIKQGQHIDHNQDSSLVALRSPLSGMVTERKVNNGAGVEAGMALFSVSNLATVFVIANVPETSVNKLALGSIAEIRTKSVNGSFSGRVAYIEPKLDEATRTARVRLETPNSNGKLRAGMFAEVGFQTGTDAATGTEIVVNSSALQRQGEKVYVFVPKADEAGVYEVREVAVGGESEGYTRILQGLKLGEKVVAKGSFTLKTQWQKAELGDE